MFALLNEYGNQDFAIQNATRLEIMWQNRKDFAKHKPRTKVHELIQEFKKLIAQYAPASGPEEKDNSGDPEASEDTLTIE